MDDIWMTLARWFYVGLFSLGSLFAITLIGKERAPYTAASVITNIVLTMPLVYLILN